MWFLIAACTPDLPPETPPPSTSTTPEPTDPPTADTATPVETADTATTPTTPSSLYPPVPYDCSQGVSPGPPAVRRVDGVLSTEDFAFDTEGWLVSADFSQNLVRWAQDGTSSVFSPGAGETRGVDVLPDRDLVFSNPDVGRLFRVDRETGGVSLLVDLTTPSASGLDVAQDGTMVVADLNGYAFVVDPDGTVHRFDHLPSQAYGAAFSLDESRAYYSSYGSVIYTSDHQDDGSWSAPVEWVDLPSSTLSGMVVDACDNLYVVSSYTCEVWRMAPDGTAELLVDLQTGPSSACPNLAFGRGLGGWDPYRLYVSTYGEVVELDVGVPGRPR